MNLRKPQYATEECAVDCCTEVAYSNGYCRRCYANRRYHLVKGAAHVRQWRGAVELKVHRLDTMLLEIHQRRKR